MIKNRNIALCIVFSIITCGVYGIYWFVHLTNEMNILVKDDYQTSGGVAFLLTLITCGLYGIFWIYKMSQKMNVLKPNSDNTVLFIVLQIFGLGIINYCIMQSELNNHANA